MRRATFLALSAAFAAAPSGAGAQTPSPTPLRIASVPNEDVLGTLWGVKSGTFAKYGLDVTLQASNSGSAVAAAVVGGAFDVGKSSILSLVTAHSKNIPLLLVAAANNYDTKIYSDGLLVKKGSPLRKAPDFNGKLFSVAALNDYFSLTVKAWMEKNGGDWQSIKFVELPQSAAPQAIADGRIDAAEIVNPTYAQALATGLVESVARPGDALAAHYVSAVYFCTAEFAAANRPTLERFVRALTESAAYVNTHHDQTAETLAQYVKLPVETIKSMDRADLSAAIPPRFVQPVVDVAYRFKAIPARFDAREMIVPYLVR